MDYCCEALTVEGFVQQLAVGYVSRGYFFYVLGAIPEKKDPRQTDEKLIRNYEIARSKWSRARLKRAGAANVQYLRFRRSFALLATHGRHRFFDEERAALRDVREVPIRFSGYSIGYRGDGVAVKIADDVYSELKAWFLENAVHRSAVALADEFRAIRYEPYGGVKKQIFALLRAVNEKRSAAGFEPVPASCLRLKRRSVRPFEHGRGEEE
jgi:hypothetical protein